MRTIIGSNALRSVFATLVSAALLPALALANRAPPPESPAPIAESVPLEVALKDGVPLRIEIPRGLLPKEAREKRAMPFGLGEFTTFASGLFVSLAIAASGIWLARRLGGFRSRPVSNRATGTIAAIVLVAGVAVAAALANAPAPPGLKVAAPADPDKLTVQISIVERGDKVVLHASPAELTKIFKPASAAAPSNAPAK